MIDIYRYKEDHRNQKEAIIRDFQIFSWAKNKIQSNLKFSNLILYIVVKSFAEGGYAVFLCPHGL